MIEKILSRLGKVRRMGEGSFMACCPAHEDRSPSLKIQQAQDRLLIHCHAGCGPDAILSALDLTWEDLYEDKWEAAKQRMYHSVKLPEPDRLDIEKRIVKLAEFDLTNGKTLSMEDEARVELAIERLGEVYGRTA